MSGTSLHPYDLICYAELIFRRNTGNTFSLRVKVISYSSTPLSVLLNLNSLVGYRIEKKGFLVYEEIGEFGSQDMHIHAQGLTIPNLLRSYFHPDYTSIELIEVRVIP